MFILITAEMAAVNDDTMVLNFTEKEALRLCRDTTIIDTIITLTKHTSPNVRRMALREMCPCRVKDDLTEFWNRVLEMRHDEDANVRYQALHDLCDGSPKHLEYRVAEALDDFNRDSDGKIRRAAHKALTSYHKKGKWNVM